MSTLCTMLSGLRGKAIALTLLGALCGTVAWFVGMDALHAVALGFVVLAVGVSWAALPEYSTEPWAREEHRHDDGSRTDVARLSWSLQARRGRVRMDALRRIRSLASARLISRGLDLDDAQDRAALEALIGPRAYRTLRANPEHAPTPADVSRALDALGALVDQTAITDPPTRRPRQERTR